MNIDKLNSIIEALRKVVEPLSALRDGAKRDPVKRFLFNSMATIVDESISDLHAMRYDGNNEIALKDALNRVTADRDAYKAQLDTYRVKLVALLPPAKDFPVVVDEIKANRKISAIKEYRTATGCGLWEAKEVIEAYVPYNDKV